MIYMLTAIGLTPGGSNTVHIYTQTVHRTAQLIWEDCGPCPVFASYTLAFALQLRKSTEKKPQSGQPKSASWHDENRIVKRDTIQINCANYEDKFNLSSSHNTFWSVILMIHVLTNTSSSHITQMCVYFSVRLPQYYPLYSYEVYIDEI